MGGDYVIAGIALGEITITVTCTEGKTLDEHILLAMKASNTVERGTTREGSG